MWNEETVSRLRELVAERYLARTRTRVTAMTRVVHGGNVRSRGFHRSWKLVGAAPIMESGERRLKAAPSWWRGIGIVELRVGVCHFPWEGDDGVIAYCGEPVTDGAGSWCKRCRGIVYRRREG